MLPGEERPSYANVGVDPLECADGALLVWYREEGVGSRDGAPPSLALRRASQACSSGPEPEEPVAGAGSRHLTQAQRAPVAAFDWDEEDYTKSEGVSAKVRGSKGKPLRHQLDRTATRTQQAR